MSNFEMDSRDRAVVILVGLPQLNNTLRLAANEPLSQRITMNFNLESLTKEETSDYIKAKLSGAKCTMDRVTNNNELVPFPRYTASDLSDMQQRQPQTCLCSFQLSGWSSNKLP